jgi:glycine/D-amino acid oxidase-like deaminating enzyme
MIKATAEDVIIIGAGVVGLTLAHGLKKVRDSCWDLNAIHGSRAASDHEYTNLVSSTVYLFRSTRETQACQHGVRAGLSQYTGHFHI